MNEWMNALIDDCIDEWVYDCIDGWMHCWMKKLTDEQMNA